MYKYRYVYVHVLAIYIYGVYICISLYNVMVAKRHSDICYIWLSKECVHLVYRAGALFELVSCFLGSIIKVC